MEQSPEDHSRPPKRGISPSTWTLALLAVLIAVMLGAGYLAENGNPFQEEIDDHDGICRLATGRVAYAYDDTECEQGLGGTWEYR